MNGGLLLRAWRETWPMTVVLGLVLMGVEAALAFVLPKFGSQMPQAWLRLEFARGIMQAMLGTEVTDSIGPQLFQSIAWVHPVVLALLWAHATMACTRVPAGEVDRGTIDVLLSLPVSRWDIFIAESVVWLICATAILLAALVGNLIGNMGLPVRQRPSWSGLSIVAANLLCLYLAAGGFTWLVSAFSNRRGRAMMLVFLVLLALFLLQYLAQFWAPLSHLVFLSPLHYHRPAQVLASGAWPWRDMSVLLGFTAVTWFAGGVVFARRDLCTV